MSAAVDFSKVFVPQGAFTLYNGSDEVVEWTCASKDFRIAPKGTLEITDIRVHPENVPSSSRHVGPAGTMPAKDVAKFAVGEDGRSGKVGRRGVRMLFGDERDEAIKREAHVTANQMKYDTACAGVRAHEAAVSKAREVGAPVPVPSPRVRQYYRDREQFEAEAGLQTYPFTCETCNAGFQTEGQLVGHRGAAHKQAAPVASPAGDTAALVTAIQAQGAAQLEAIKEMGTAQAKAIAEVLGAVLPSLAGGRGGKRKRRKAAEQTDAPKSEGE